MNLCAIFNHAHALWNACVSECGLNVRAYSHHVMDSAPPNRITLQGDRHGWSAARSEFSGAVQTAHCS